MSKIRGYTVASPMKRPDFNQTDSRKSDYIKNNPFPRLSATDEGKVLQVKDGKYVTKDMPALGNTDGFVKKLKPDTYNLVYVEQTRDRGLLGKPVIFGCAPWSIPERDGNGYLHVKINTPTETDEATPKSYVDGKVSAMIPNTAKGAANGVATLDQNGHIPSTQLPAYVDSVIEGYISDNRTEFYEDAAKTKKITATTGKIYVDIPSLRTFRWGGTVFATISESISLGETSTTAYYGDKGKTAYAHSQTTGNPHNLSLSNLGISVTAADLNKINSKANKTEVPSKTENWTFTLEDGSIVTKAVYVK